MRSVEVNVQAGRAPSWARSRIVDAALCLLLVTLAISTFVSGVDAVPYHPDESSWLRMGVDAEVFLVRGDVEALVLDGGDGDADDALRLLNAPLSKYIVGLATLAAGFEAAQMPHDWVWGETWEANAMAIPAPDVLRVGRLAIAVFAAFGAGLIFWLAAAAGGRLCGGVAALAYVVDPLVLLHGRRAMAEGALLTTLLLALLVIAWADHQRSRQRAGRRPWAPPLIALLVGVSIGLAACAKQTNLFLAGVAVAIVSWNGSFSWRAALAPALARVAVQIFALGLGLGGVFLVANPVVWRDPLAGARKMLEARVSLIALQVDVVRRLDPQPDTRLAADPGGQLLNGLRSAFVTPPESWDIPLYLERLAPEAERYLSGPSSGLARGPVTSAALLSLAFLGWVGFLGSGLRHSGRSVARVVLMWTAVCIGVFGLTIPIAWQRYFVGILPIYWIGLGLGAANIARFMRAWLSMRGWP